MAAVSRRQFAVGALGAVAVGFLDACSRGHHAAASGPQPTKALAKATPATKPPAPPATLAVSPGSGTANVSPTAPITVTAAAGTLTTVTLVSSDGTNVAGALSADQATWTANQVLGYGHNYTLTAGAINADGVPASTTATFSTLNPDNMTNASINTRAGAALQNGGVYGVGMIIRVNFDEEIDDKAAAEKALVVTTVPPVEGSWYWIDDQNALWRPEVYYASGTKVTVNANVYGVQVGNGLYGQADVAAAFTIGDKHISIADDNTHQVQVFFNDVLQRTMPTSMGRGGYISGTEGQISLWTPSGIYTVLDKSNPVLMDSSTFGLPVNSPLGYKEYISWATRITTDGIYLHELDTTVWAQGNTDTSHGCLNLNQDNATWFFNNAQIGDVVAIQNTGGPPGSETQGSDWAIPWATWKASSALNS